jgi:stage III sporulation protein AG
MTDTYQQPPAERCVKSMKKSGKLAVALVGILLGGLLLFFGNRAGKDTPDTAPNAPPETSAHSAEDYRAELESRAKTLCAQVAGVGEVDVLITLSGGFEYVYAADTRSAAGGMTTSYVTVGSGSGESLVYITEKPPAIVGIGVVCAGGMDPTVRQEVTALLSAAFGIGSNKIYVTGHK